MKIAIIGGGISGISTAFWLEYFAKERLKSIDITIFEKNKRLGGTINTFYKDNFIIESGPNGFLDSKPYTVETFEKAGLGDNLIRSNELAKKRYIMRGGVLHKLPEKPNEFFSSKLLSFKGKLRVISELFIPAKKDEYDETIEEFAYRRLGKEAADYLISPMVSGVFAGDPSKLSLKSCFPVIYNLEKEYGGLFKAMFKKKGKKSGPAGPGGNLTSYKGGLIKGINALTEQLSNTKIYLGEEVTGLDKTNGSFKVKTTNSCDNYDIVIITSPAYVAAEFIKGLSVELSDKLLKLNYAPMYVIGFGFKEEDVLDPLDGFGFLVPHNENRKILGALFTSSIFPERAPKGYKLIRVMIGGDKNRWVLNCSEDELRDIAFNEIKDILGVKGNSVVEKSFYWERAIPQYYQGHEKLVEDIESICMDINNIYIGGNLLYGIGINDCTKRSIDIARGVLGG
ncbi:protoporphyrinogen oxidase [Deferribacter desulfuricans SSM1]|uniref:Coproporphyrinogen III oxidase n=1 Tax=Deferribacter desulfuricans (strain DSM 14783 / JCM 11476 / NBRC 101012 / SSM1) TaxID=639282 RepID=D3PDZ4_DEFDS|nr:protoporphyrinogen oxidase [Deferribacter desulfuricans]BAI80817.1 protoporphyrinogen oxidase [Deferribacter desulfuricans SSM1]